MSARAKCVRMKNNKQAQANKVSFRKRGREHATSREYCTMELVSSVKGGALVPTFRNVNERSGLIEKKEC